MPDSLVVTDIDAVRVPLRRVTLGRPWGRSGRLVAPWRGADHVSPALRDGLDEPFIAKHRDCPPGGVASDLECLLEILFRWQRVKPGPELACLDPGAQPGGDLPVRRLGCPGVDRRRLHVGQRTQTGAVTFVYGRWSSLGVPLAFGYQTAPAGAGTPDQGLTTGGPSSNG
jgi:hypothetical protein